ncbi:MULTISPECIES: hypothetical protein [Campylobacter]|uniref:hypothetical protein n=1 Tax=Campylobacter TaxID=194 RepID=UPI001CEC6C5B|nr:MULTISPECIES: hypothetical protein [Campylobacter]MCE7085967.1 hypothetical protein [Campylobacter coli]MCE7091423.1 hypothetical protein [Campylobacter coli]MCE7115552.1 hypothetical protein [Campylobacter coli]MCE7134380.1 hypothetical protein [Campylobacter coli]MCE7149869.1 hypothetical protein [Campylobacter coli]
MLSQIQNNTSIQVASFYEVTKNSITKHFLRNADELIENIHYFYDYEQTKGGRQRVIKWTLEGVYKLFDKIKKLKERSNMAEEKENIVKKVCKELGLTYRQLGELIGLSEGRVKQLAIGEVGEQVEKACQMLIKIHKLEAELNEQKQLKTLLKNFIS